jgi:hypothetical protein
MGRRRQWNLRYDRVRQRIELTGTAEGNSGRWRTAVGTPITVGHIVGSGETLADIARPGG